jgi:hypothetical protein
MSEELKQAIRDLKRAYMRCYHDAPLSEVSEEIFDLIQLFDVEVEGRIDVPTSTHLD